MIRKCSHVLEFRPIYDAIVNAINSEFKLNVNMLGYLFLGTRHDGETAAGHLSRMPVYHQFGSCQSND